MRSVFVVVTESGGPYSSHLAHCDPVRWETWQPMTVAVEAMLVVLGVAVVVHCITRAVGKPSDDSRDE